MRSFLTGSHAYGSPRPDSDLDLVVFVDELTAERLASFCDLENEFDEQYEEADARSLRFGKLNLLVVTDEKHFELWRRGTDELKERAKMLGRSLTREYAIGYLAELRKNAGVKF